MILESINGNDSQYIYYIFYLFYKDISIFFYFYIVINILYLLNIDIKCNDLTKVMVRSELCNRTHYVMITCMYT